MDRLAWLSPPENTPKKQPITLAAADCVDGSREGGRPNKKLQFAGSNDGRLGVYSSVLGAKTEIPAKQHPVRESRMPVRLILLALYAAIGYTQPSVCDPDLIRLVNPRNPAHYQLRGTRCEGVYDPERAGDAALSLASFTSSVAMFDPQRDRNLFVRWAGPEASVVHLRGYSLKPRSYYQMDAALEPGKTPFTWPLDVVRDVGIQRRELAVVAWTSYKAGQITRDVYLPVAITAGNSGAAQASSPRITLWPGRSLNEIFLTVQALNAGLDPASTLLKDEPFGAGDIYPAEVPIALDWKRLKIATPGFYSLKIGATVVNGTPATLRLTLYYANP
jgi:hypothetical protein